MQILSWNINGLRAIARKGFRDWVLHTDPDILCLQETKAQPAQITPDILAIDNYSAYFSTAEKKGYSGVAVYTRLTPKKIESKFNDEGRIIKAEYKDFILLNIYFPNGGASAARLKYKLQFYDNFISYLKKQKTKPVIICGDFNTAHQAIDLARPKENLQNSGFMAIERKRIDQLLALGLVDIFRALNPQVRQYSYWDLQTRARERNVGWRIDYFLVSKALAPKVQKAYIMPEVLGSDHCPVGIDLKL